MSWPRLSGTPPKHEFNRWTCLVCGDGHDAPGNEDMQLWIECDDHDQPTLTVIALCPNCAGRLIEPHPRLYIRMQRHQPIPGVMECCQGCRFQLEMSCTNPSAKFNGGPGLLVRYPQPSS